MRTVEVYRAFYHGRLRQVGLSAEQVARLCPESTGPGWVMDSVRLTVPEARGVVHTWPSGRDHVHWNCPRCGRLHISDFLPHADSNPVLWFCEGGGPDDLCLVRWERETERS